MTALNLNIEQYDAIVVGTGVSGGWAAKELCENGLKTLVYYYEFGSLGYETWWGLLSRNSQRL